MLWPRATSLFRVFSQYLLGVCKLIPTCAFSKALSWFLRKNTMYKLKEFKNSFNIYVNFDRCGLCIFLRFLLLSACLNHLHLDISKVSMWISLQFHIVLLVIFVFTCGHHLVIELEFSICKICPSCYMFHVCSYESRVRES